MYRKVRLEALSQKIMSWRTSCASQNLRMKRSDLILIDSYGRIEHFAEDPLADKFPPIGCNDRDYQFVSPYAFQITELSLFSIIRR